jgi:hypothetical protein
MVPMGSRLRAAPAQIPARAANADSRAGVRPILIIGSQVQGAHAPPGTVVSGRGRPAGAGELEREHRRDRGDRGNCRGAGIAIGVISVGRSSSTRFGSAQTGMAGVQHVPWLNCTSGRPTVPDVGAQQPGVNPAYASEKRSSTRHLHRKVGSSGTVQCAIELAAGPAWAASQRAVRVGPAPAAERQVRVVPHADTSLDMHRAASDTRAVGGNCGTGRNTCYGSHCPLRLWP